MVKDTEPHGECGKTDSDESTVQAIRPKEFAKPQSINSLVRKHTQDGEFVSTHLEKCMTFNLIKLELIVKLFLYPPEIDSKV